MSVVDKKKIMGLLKTVLIGAAVYGAVKYVTKKNADGKSIADDLKQRAPEWKNKVMQLKDEVAPKF